MGVENLDIAILLPMVRVGVSIAKWAQVGAFKLSIVIFFETNPIPILSVIFIRMRPEWIPWGVLVIEVLVDPALCDEALQREAMIFNPTFGLARVPCDLPRL